MAHPAARPLRLWNDTAVLLVFVAAAVAVIIDFGEADKPEIWLVVFFLVMLGVYNGLGGYRLIKAIRQTRDQANRAIRTSVGCGRSGTAQTPEYVHCVWTTVSILEIWDRSHLVSLGATLRAPLLDEMACVVQSDAWRLWK